MAAPPELRRVLIAAAWITAAAVAVITVTSGLPAGGAAAMTVIVTTAVGLGAWCVALVLGSRRVWLVAVLLVTTGLAGAMLQWVHPQGPGFVLAYMALAGLGLALPRRNAVLLAVLVGAAIVAAEMATHPRPVAAGTSLAAGCSALFLATLLAGASRDAHESAQSQLRQETRLAAAREEAAALTERQRIARELHDVLAHTLAGLALQLEGARLLADRTGADPRLAEQVASSQRLAREGMTSAKRAVEALRGDDLPGPAALPALVAQSRLAGLAVTLSVTGAPRPVLTEASLALYRVVQEALTNCAKYVGRDALVTVALTWGASEVTAEIVDTGGSVDVPALPSGGYGLAGLAERAALAGGSLVAGPVPGGGWRVRVTMPVVAAEARPAGVA